MSNEVESAALRAIDLGMVFDMKAYTAQTIDLYKKCAKVSSVKPALTPFVAEGSLNPDEDEITGTLAPVACKILMKALWLARLARPDILKPIGDLASNVQKWSRNHDRQLLRLIQYLVGACHRRLVGTGILEADIGGGDQPRTFLVRRGFTLPPTVGASAR